MHISFTGIIITNHKYTIRVPTWPWSCAWHLPYIGHVCISLEAPIHLASSSYAFLCACWCMEKLQVPSKLILGDHVDCRSQHQYTSVVFNSDAGEPVRLDPQPPDFSGQALKTSFHISCLSKHHFAPMPGLQLSTLNSVMSILQLSWITSSFPHKSWPSAITYHFHCSQFFAIFRHGSILGKWQYFTNLNQLWGWCPLINHDFQRSVAVRSL